MNKYLSLENRLIEYSVTVIKFTRSLIKDDSCRYLSNQLIRSSCSSALNYGEARDAESRRDFIHKMKICLKELRETSVWLKILAEAKLVRQRNELEALLNENNQLISIFVASAKTARKNQKKTS